MTTLASNGNGATSNGAKPADKPAAAPASAAAAAAPATNGAAAEAAPKRSRALIKKKEPIPEDTPVSEDEKEYVKEFRGKMGAKADNLSDMTILRFVRGFCCSDNPEEKALEMLTKMTEWRAKEKVDDIAKMKISFKTQFNETWNSGIHGLDKAGHPIFVDRPGLCNPSDLKAKNFDMAKIMLVHIQHMESLIATETAVSKLRGLNRYKHIAIIDMQGLGMKHLSSEFYTPMKTIIDIDQYYYPDTLFKLFVVNAPFVFRAMWAIVSPMVDPVTKNKIEFGTTNLEKYIDKESLPKFLGGTCKCAEGKCLRVPFLSGKDEKLPDIDIGKGPKDENGRDTTAAATATAAAGTAPTAGTATAPAAAATSAAAAAAGNPNGPAPSAPPAEGSSDGKSAPASAPTTTAAAAAPAAASEATSAPATAAAPTASAAPAPAPASASTSTSAA